MIPTEAIYTNQHTEPGIGHVTRWKGQKDLQECSKDDPLLRPQGILTNPLLNSPQARRSRAQAALRGSGQDVAAVPDPGATPNYRKQSFPIKGFQRNSEEDGRHGTFTKC